MAQKTDEPLPLHCSCGRMPTIVYEGEGMSCGCGNFGCWMGPVRLTYADAVEAWNLHMSQVRPTTAQGSVISYTLPYPPSVNHYWRSNAKGRVFIAAEGKKYREAVGYAILEAGRRELGTGAVEIAVRVWPPDNRKRDLDNVLKALLDALEASRVYADDSQIDRLVVERRPVLKGGQVTVHLWPLLPVELEDQEGDDEQG